MQSRDEFWRVLRDLDARCGTLDEIPAPAGVGIQQIPDCWMPCPGPVSHPTILYMIHTQYFSAIRSRGMKRETGYPIDAQRKGDQAHG
jgi:hypothetical protein